MDIPKTYDQSKEAELYKLWEDSGYFNPDNLQGAKDPFTIMMPLPNANGKLHIGHALGMTLQDLMTRYQRMQGKKALWLPGTDHAGFETQVVFEKKLEKEGRTRFDMTRDEFYKETMEFVQENRKHTEEGIRRLGASCDWSRNIFTLDPRIIKIVYETFEQMYKDGLAYRGWRIVNICPKHLTSLSELETRHENRQGLYYIKYGDFEVATVRPETIFGDIALGINPKDKNKHSGKIARHPIDGRVLSVIYDAAVDPEFGTGVVKITPAHDEADFEMWKRYRGADDKQFRQDVSDYTIINRSGRLTKFRPKLIPSEYEGLKINEARDKIVENLQNKKLLAPDRNYQYQVPVCYKCNRDLQPIPDSQWFIAMTKKINDKRLKIKDQSLRDMAVEAVKSKKIKINPPRFEKVFMHWMENLRDWNISRQIVWGIPIPVWYCVKCDQEIFKAYRYHPDLGEGTGRSFVQESFNGSGMAVEAYQIKKLIDSGKMGIPEKANPIVFPSDEPGNCPTCKVKDHLIQDPDTFDTWFSSGQWPYITLQAQSKKDFKTYYPGSVMETGWDILFFWVARMIMLGLYKTGEVPFEHVYLHGLVRDKDRQKMSKSKGNVVDPLGVIDQYGVDALRMALLVGNLPGTDTVISEEKVKGYRNFANKIWNASRFVLQNVTDLPSPLAGEGGRRPGEGLTAADKAILKELDLIVKDTTRLMEKMDFAHAAENLYHYFWHTFADKIIEQAKPKLADEKTKASAQYTLHTILETSLKLLHPFMPFVTETIWQLNHDKLLMIEPWPTKK